MLERVHYIKGLGLLHDVNGAPFSLQKASLFYADNGRGKSTLASLFRSCATNNPALVTKRRTIDGVNEPETRLQFSNGQNAIFQNGSWDNQRQELLVFDADFVEKNVYSGGQVTADNRKNLLQFALGDTAVAAQQVYDLANESLTTAKVDVVRLKTELSAHHGDSTLLQFRSMNPVDDAETQIEAINLRIAEAQDIENIQVRLMPVALNMPVLDVVEVLSILQSSLDDIDVNAEARVKQHLEHHKHQLLEGWVSSGQDFLDKDTCPLCDQPLEGVDLIQAYRSYFNQEYKNLMTNVSQLDDKVERLFSQTIADNIQTEVNTTVERLTNWHDKVLGDLPGLNIQKTKYSLTELMVYVAELVNQKKQNILECVGNDVNATHINTLWEQISQAIERFNQELQPRIDAINQYKEGLAAVDVNQLRQQLATINCSQRRHEQAVVQLFQELDTANGLVKGLELRKVTAKQQLSTVMSQTLTHYRVEINAHLLRFGASFSIAELDANFTGGGGQPTSKFALEMRGQPLALMNGNNAFKTALSEGDKRTLALAFFIAYAESLVNLVDSIIVIDDPMCSLDLNRKHQTRLVIKNLHDNCHQLILLAHDAHFLREFRNDLLRPTGANPLDIRCVRLKAVAHNYSGFDDIDLDQECESSYFKAHRLLKEYLDGQHPGSINVARSVRPMLEGYLHRRFPGMINHGVLFGAVVTSINDAQQPSPLVHAQNITGELNQINGYVGQYHHDTNPAADQVQVIDGELRTYVTRALAVIHSGDA
ncbi:MAG: wobble nucleotide-excising tRNase [Paraglaciecola sp.]|jgi:wobble nucleotide-excising tRNase